MSSIISNSIPYYRCYSVLRTGLSGRKAGYCVYSPCKSNIQQINIVKVSRIFFFQILVSKNCFSEITLVSNGHDTQFIERMMTRSCPKNICMKCFMVEVPRQKWQNNNSELKTL